MGSNEIEMTQHSGDEQVGGTGDNMSPDKGAAYENADGSHRVFMGEEPSANIYKDSNYTREQQKAQKYTNPFRKN